MNILEDVKEIIAEHLGILPQEVKGANLIEEELGADSLDTVELIMAFEEKYDIEISDKDAEELKTVTDVAEYLKGILGDSNV